MIADVHGVDPVMSGVAGWWISFNSWVWTLWFFSMMMVTLAMIFHYSNMRFPSNRPQVQYSQITTLITSVRYASFPFKIGDLQL